MLRPMAYLSERGTLILKPANLLRRQRESDVMLNCRSLIRLTVLLLLLCKAHLSAYADTVPTVAAAADLKFALEEISKQFQRDTGKSVQLTFGSSGVFKTQIENGAPFQVFLSADEHYVFQLAERGLTVDRGSLYAVGRLVWFIPQGTGIPAQLDQLSTAVHTGRIQRFAIANPQHAPYGRAAQAALQHLQLWDALKPKLVYGENASQAMQFAASGATQGGLVPLSLSKVPEMAHLGQFILIPAQWHASEPLRQRAVLLRSAEDSARQFYHYLQQPSARQTFERYGFMLPPTP